jgi:hypothetical protein
MVMDGEKGQLLDLTGREDVVLERVCAEESEVNQRKADILRGREKGKKIKKIQRSGNGTNGEKVVIGAKKKRDDEMDVDCQNETKKGKGANGESLVHQENLTSAGLSEQPCEAQ